MTRIKDELFMTFYRSSHRVVYAVVVVWVLSLLTGFVPVFTGIYSSEEHLDLSRYKKHRIGNLLNSLRYSGKEQSRNKRGNNKHINSKLS